MGTHPATRTTVSVAVAAALLIAGSGRLSAQYVHGVVLDQSTQAPVESADVEILGTKGKVSGQVLSRERTDKGGKFGMMIRKVGAYAVKVDAPGYLPYTTHLFTMDTYQDTRIEVSLAPARAPAPAKGASVTMGALRRRLEKVGFYGREKKGLGHFLTPEQLAGTTVGRITDDFYDVPGVEVQHVRHGGGEAWDITLAGAKTEHRGGLCYPTIYLDGDMIRKGGSGPTVEANAGLWTELVRPSQVAAAEVYADSAGLPAFASGSESPCGTVLIWTRTP